MPQESGQGTEVDRAARVSRGRKSATAFRTISEVAEDLGVQQHVLRFWESKFRQVKPLKRAGGRRFYRPEDVDLLRAIKKLLRDERYTIEGAQKLLNANGGKLSAIDSADGLEGVQSSSASSSFEKDTMTACEDVSMQLNIVDSRSVGAGQLASGVNVSDLSSILNDLRSLRAKIVS